ncbi:MAG: hypothetical protein JW810_06690, partial [Sedimentisphaerales bacterium]|nr:hypothetical protein [Sedimentisphaerales bacterium]
MNTTVKITLVVALAAAIAGVVLLKQTDPFCCSVGPTEPSPRQNVAGPNDPAIQSPAPLPAALPQDAPPDNPAESRRLPRLVDLGAD